MNMMVEKLNQLEEYIAYMMSSGLQHLKQDVEELRSLANDFNEWGFPHLAKSIQHLADTDHSTQLMQLFLLHRQIEWLRWNFLSAEEMVGKGKKPVIEGKEEKTTLTPLSVLNWEEDIYYLSHIQGTDNDLVLIKMNDLPHSPMEMAYEVHQLHFEKRVILHSHFSLPVFTGEFTPIPNSDISIRQILKANRHDLMGTIFNNKHFRFGFSDISKEDAWNKREYDQWLILEPYQSNVESLTQQTKIRCYGCYIPINRSWYRPYFWPVFVTEIRKIPGESKVVHLYERVWEEGELALYD